MDESKVERSLRKYYENGMSEGLNRVFTPKEVRDKMTIYAERGMKVLVLFNHEFCHDLYAKGIKDVTFASDDQLRNEIVEGVWGYETELLTSVAIKNIKETLEGMKFDLIISNPPYNNGIDLKILDSIKELGDKICFVHPAGWLLDNTFNTKVFNSLRESFRNRLKSVEIFNGNEKFGIFNQFPCAVTFFTDISNSISINDESKFYFDDVKKYSVDDIFDIDKYAWYSGYRRLESKIMTYDNYLIPDDISEKDDFTLKLPLIRGHIATNDFFTFVSIDKSRHLDTHKNGQGWKFKTDKESENCYDYLCTKIARFCLSLKKRDANMSGAILGSTPKLDFSKSWSDEEVAKELGITNEELLWIIDQLPDYYPEDKEKYEQLKNKLKLCMN